MPNGQNEPLYILVKTVLDKGTADKVRQEIQDVMGRRPVKIFYDANPSPSRSRFYGQRVAAEVAGIPDFTAFVHSRADAQALAINLKSGITTGGVGNNYSPIQPLAAKEIQQSLHAWNKEITVFQRHSSNAVASFWSVWSVSWAVKGVLSDIVGFSDKWLNEANKLTRAFQAGLYLYAGGERILKGVSNTLLHNNIHYKASIVFLQVQQKAERELLELQAKRLHLKAQGLSVDKVDSDIKAKQLEIEEAQANVAYQKSLAEKATVSSRASLLSLGSTVTAVAAVAIGIFGVIRWIQNLKTELKTAQLKAESLRNEFTALGTTNVTLKTSFTSVSDVVNKLSTQFEDFKKKVRDVVNPTEQLALAMREIAEQTTRLNLLNEGTITVSPLGDLSDIDKFQNKQQLILKSWSNLFNGSRDINAQANAWWNEIFRNRNSAITNAFKSPEQIQNYYNTHREEIINKLVEQRKESLLKEGVSQEYVNKHMQQFNLEAGTYLDNMVQIALQATKMENALNGANIQLANQYNQLAKNNAQYAGMAQQFTQYALSDIKEQIKEIDAKLANTSQQTPTEYIKQLQEQKAQLLVAQQRLLSTGANSAGQQIKDFYRQMYEAYKDAAKHDSSFQQQADYWKKLYINRLHQIITTDKEWLRTAKRGTDEWKSKNLELAKAQQALADMLETSKKLNATWWNIPTAVIRPTKAQLTSTALLQPTFHIYGNTVEELTKKVKETLQDFVISEETNTGTIGGAT